MKCLACSQTRAWDPGFPLPSAHQPHQRRLPLGRAGPTNMSCLILGSGLRRERQGVGVNPLLNTHCHPDRQKRSFPSAEILSSSLIRTKLRHTQSLRKRCQESNGWRRGLLGNSFQPVDTRIGAVPSVTYYPSPRSNHCQRRFI